MSNLVLPAETRMLIENLTDHSPHGVLLTGPQGIGLTATALLLAERLGKLIEHIKPEIKTSGAAGSISIETVRALYTQTHGKRTAHEVVIIEDADSMHQPAQNALLKLLEEPTSGLTFILTAHSPDVLLPTIRSRLQSHSLARLSDSESQNLIRLAGIKDETTMRQLMFAASGLPAMLNRLASDSKQLEVVSNRMKRVRQFIENGTYVRLTVIAQLTEDRNEAIAFIDAVIDILRYSLAIHVEKARILQIDRMLETRNSLVANGNIRLHLMRAVL